jgi:hypothetical protein
VGILPDNHQQLERSWRNDLTLAKKRQALREPDMNARAS